MRLVISSRAEKQLEKLPRLKQLIVAEKIRAIGAGRSVTGEEQLKGVEKMYRARVGDYRVVYRKTAEEVHVVLVGHRKEVYRLMERLLG